MFGWDDSIRNFAIDFLTWEKWDNLSCFCFLSQFLYKRHSIGITRRLFMLSYWPLAKVRPFHLGFLATELDNRAFFDKLFFLAKFYFLGQLCRETIKVPNQFYREAANKYLTNLIQKVSQYRFNETDFQLRIHWKIDGFVYLQSHILEARTEKEASLAWHQ